MNSPTTHTSSHDETPAPWNALWVLALGLALIILDSSIVNVSLPTIIDAININLTDAQWITSLYSIILAALLLPAGKLGDMHGRRNLFLIGLVIFMTGSGLAAGAANGAILLIARAVQGIGGAFIMPSTLSTVSAAFRGKARAVAFGVWGAVMASAAAIGPLLGGILTTTVGWRWIFLVNIPLGLIACYGAWRFVPETRSDERHETTSSIRSDFIGLILLAVGAAAVVFALIEGQDYGWWSPQRDFTLAAFTWPSTWPISPIPCCLATGVVLLVIAIMHEHRRIGQHKLVILDVTLFRFPAFAWGNLAAGAVFSGEMIAVFVLPLYLINVRGMSSLGAGAILAILALGALVSGGLARHFASSIGPAATVRLGLCIEIVGIGLAIAMMGTSITVWALSLVLALYGFGLGLASAQLTSLVLADVPVAQSGQASATQSTIRQCGSAVGAALAGSVLSGVITHTVPASLQGIAGISNGLATGLSESLAASAGTVIPALRAQGAHGKFGEATIHVADMMAAGFTHASQWTLASAMVLIACGLCASLRVKASRES